MLPRLFPAVEQLEERYLLSVAAAPPVHPANPGPANHGANQTIPAIVQAVRGPVQRIDASVPTAIAAALAPVPLAAIPVTAPPLPLGAPPTTSPLDLPVVIEASAVSEVLDVGRVDEPAVPDADVMTMAPTVVIVTSVDPESEFVVPAVADAHVEPVRAPSIRLAQPARAPAATAEPAVHDHLPLLVWMVGMASVVALRSERRRGNAVSR